MFETGYKRTGDIQPARNQFNNQNNNAALDELQARVTARVQQRLCL
jgi:hypothetical protein